MQLAVRTDFSSRELRQLATRVKDAAQARHVLAIAEGRSGRQCGAAALISAPLRPPLHLGQSLLRLAPRQFPLHRIAHERGAILVGGQHWRDAGEGAGREASAHVLVPQFGTAQQGKMRVRINFWREKTSPAREQMRYKIENTRSYSEVKSLLKLACVILLLIAAANPTWAAPRCVPPSRSLIAVAMSGVTLRLDNNIWTDAMTATPAQRSDKVITLLGTLAYLIQHTAPLPAQREQAMANALRAVRRQYDRLMALSELREHGRKIVEEENRRQKLNPPLAMPPEDFGASYGDQLILEEIITDTFTTCSTP
jgi:hypothetical protein